jgi:Pentapeptide repeats (8 copies)
MNLGLSTRNTSGLPSNVAVPADSFNNTEPGGKNPADKPAPQPNLPTNNVIALNNSIDDWFNAEQARFDKVVSTDTFYHSTNQNIINSINAYMKNKGGDVDAISKTTLSIIRNLDNREPITIPDEIDRYVLLNQFTKIAQTMNPQQYLDYLKRLDSEQKKDWWNPLEKSSLDKLLDQVLPTAHAIKQGIYGNPMPFAAWAGKNGSGAYVAGLADGVIEAQVGFGAQMFKVLNPVQLGKELFDAVTKLPADLKELFKQSSNILTFKSKLNDYEKGQVIAGLAMTLLIVDHGGRAGINLARNRIAALNKGLLNGEGFAQAKQHLSETQGGNAETRNGPPEVTPTPNPQAPQMVRPSQESYKAAASVMQEIKNPEIRQAFANEVYRKWQEGKTLTADDYLRVRNDLEKDFAGKIRQNYSAEVFESKELQAAYRQALRDKFGDKPQAYDNPTTSLAIARTVALDHLESQVFQGSGVPIEAREAFRLRAKEWANQALPENPAHALEWLMTQPQGITNLLRELTVDTLTGHTYTDLQQLAQTNPEAAKQLSELRLRVGQELMTKNSSNMKDLLAQAGGSARTALVREAVASQIGGRSPMARAIADYAINKGMGEGELVDLVTSPKTRIDFMKKALVDDTLASENPRQKLSPLQRQNLSNGIDQKINEMTKAGASAKDIEKYLKDLSNSGTTMGQMVSPKPGTQGTGKTAAKPTTDATDLGGRATATAAQHKGQHQINSNPDVRKLTSNVNMDPPPGETDRIRATAQQGVYMASERPKGQPYSTPTRDRTPVFDDTQVGRLARDLKKAGNPLWDSVRYLDNSPLARSGTGELRLTSGSATTNNPRLKENIAEVQKLNPKIRINASGADLSHADLSGLNFEGANFSNANLSGAKLEGVNLNDADLSNANLSYANLKGTKLDTAHMKNANFIGAIVDFGDKTLKDSDVAIPVPAKPVDAPTPPTRQSPATPAKEPQRLLKPYDGTRHISQTLPNGATLDIYPPHTMSDPQTRGVAATIISGNRRDWNMHIRGEHPDRGDSLMQELNNSFVITVTPKDAKLPTGTIALEPNKLGQGNAYLGKLTSADPGLGASLIAEATKLADSLAQTKVNFSANDGRLKNMYERRYGATYLGTSNHDGTEMFDFQFDLTDPKVRTRYSLPPIESRVDTRGLP